MTGASTEVLIVGGGPAGLAAAIALRRRDMGCVVVEARAPGIDKACGEGLTPQTLASLRALGVAVTAGDGFPFRGMRFVNARSRVDASFPDGTGVGMRRPVLHARLAERATAAGASVLWNSRVKLAADGAQGAETQGGTALVNGEPLRYRWLVGADGQASSVRRWAGLDGLKRRARQRVRFGVRRHYQVAPWSEFVEIHWGPRGQLYVTPVGPDCVCVVLVSRGEERDREDMLQGFPEVAERLRGAAMSSGQRGAVSLTRRLERVAAGSVALVGDASGSIDAITGEGLAMSFRQAEALAEAVVSGSIDSYGEAHTKIGKLPHAMGELLLSMNRWPKLEVRAMRALAAKPDLFGDLLRVHLGLRSLGSFAVRRGMRLGWEMVSAAG